MRKKKNTLAQRQRLLGLVPPRVSHVIPPLPLLSRCHLTFVICHLLLLPPLAAPSSLSSPLLVAAPPHCPFLIVISPPHCCLPRCCHGGGSWHGFVACPIPVISGCPPVPPTSSCLWQVFGVLLVMVIALSWSSWSGSWQWWGWVRVHESLSNYFH
jgi:hypothetical protein